MSREKPVFVVQTWWGLLLWIFFLGITHDIALHWLKVWGIL